LSSFATFDNTRAHNDFIKALILDFVRYDKKKMMKIMKNKGVEQRFLVRKCNTMLIFGFKNTY
jgi:hypothetical protein